MTLDSQLVAEINSCKYLFVREISEPRNNTLRLVVEEGKASDETTSRSFGKVELADLHEIRSNPECHLYEFVWDCYVIYSILNESFGVLEDSAVFSGHLLRVFSKSNFLRYAALATLATDEYPGTLLHIGLLAQNHLVDVISTVEPRITRVR